MILDYWQCCGAPARGPHSVTCIYSQAASAASEVACPSCVTLRADLARVTEEASEHRSIVASLWDYLRSRDAVPPREGSDHDRIMVGLGTLELRATAALAAERERWTAEPAGPHRVRELSPQRAHPLFRGDTGFSGGFVVEGPIECTQIFNLRAQAVAVANALNALPTPTTEARDA